MQNLEIKLKNCYWIKSLEHEFHFDNSNVYSIYAPNGTMKTSFLKTFNQLEKKKKPCDEIYWLPSVYEIKIDWNKIKNTDIFTIESLDTSFESNKIWTLLINESLQILLEDFFWKRENFLNEISILSGIKVNSKSTKTWKIENILENLINNDFNITSFLELLKPITLTQFTEDYSDILYWEIFDTSIIKIIESNDFQEEIENYLEKIQEIYWENNFLKSWEFTLWRLEEINDSLKNHHFFNVWHSINLNWLWNSINQTQIDSKIQEIKTKISQTEEFIELTKKLNTSKWVKLLELIERKPDLVNELKLENISNFKKKIWTSYFKKHSEVFTNIINLYNTFVEQRANIDYTNSKWFKVIEEFKRRFYVPFSMDIKNKENVIIWAELPNIVFQFCQRWDLHNCNDEDCLNIWNLKELPREDLDWKNILSQWEKRALYLLNILFEIEVKKQDNKEYLLIIDDIADSFDYKNKYAIIQYLKELSEIEINIWTEEEPILTKKFKMIILTHNFDFYRTLKYRLWLKISDNNEETSNFIVNKNSSEIKLENWTSFLNSIIEMIKNCNTFENLVSLIPIARNIIEYRFWDNDDYYDYLTCMVHIKLNKYKLSDLINIFEETFNINIERINEENDKETLDIIYNFCERYTEIENENEFLSIQRKIILSLWIRLQAENFMLSKLWDIEEEWNQTWKLYEKCCNQWLINDYENLILKDVFLMTPENIHLNSFMYEPILDMSDWHLKELYKKAKSLNENISN